MLNNWDKWMAKKHKKIRLRCQKGIPPSLRGRAWQYLSGSKVKLQQNSEKFGELDESPGDPKWLDVIERDLHRQFPFHEMFVSRGGHGQQDLFRVLKAYTLYRPEEGYCQAQAPIAAVLLMHMPAEQAFWCLVQICEKYLPGYYSEKLEAIQLDGEILFSLLQKVSPVAHKHLSRQKIDPLLYMTEWFMCAFARTLPWSSVLRVWDMFFCEGVKIIFRVGLVLLKHSLGSPEKLKACQGQYETIERLRSLSPKITQEAFLVQEVIELPVTERQIEREHLIQLRRWQETRGELQCRSSPRLHGAKAILEAEPGPRPTLQPSASIRLPPEASLPGSKGNPKLPKQSQKAPQKQAKAGGQLDKPPPPSKVQVAAAAGDACPPQDGLPKDPVHQDSAAPQHPAHHRSKESLTSQEKHRVRVLSLARSGLWLYTHPLIKLLFLPRRSRCKFFSLTETPEDYTLMVDEEGFKELPPSEFLQVAEATWLVLNVSSHSGALVQAAGVTKIARSVITPLAEHHVSVLMLSTYQTDFILVREQDLSVVIHTLAQEFHIYREVGGEPVPVATDDSSNGFPRTQHGPSPTVHPIQSPQNRFCVLTLDPETLPAIATTLIDVLFYSHSAPKEAAPASPGSSSITFFAFSLIEGYISIVMDAETQKKYVPLTLGEPQTPRQPRGDSEVTELTCPRGSQRAGWGMGRPAHCALLPRFPSDLLLTSSSGELWRMVRIGGQPLGFDECGIVAQIAGPLAAADISAYYISTFNFDHALVPEDGISSVIEALQRRQEGLGP
ncbi:TBC1 domain family member 10A [Galemys pyrenaicus]|uniref:Cytosolic arginine sensor for mTORC1 subunit 1 n=1 Tax=Galemys pyrenaicus TaxID=202257 RepID=A0A8J6AI55_GALPY|nr:TBC1 domain family member 10A [Galemys pyrenaicus]